MKTAFILFCEDDRPAAEQLEHFLRHYPLPPGAAALRVEHDAPELLDSGYYDIVDRHFAKADRLIVIGSPEAARDRHLDSHIREFAARNRGSKAVSAVIFNPPETASLQDLFPPAFSEMSPLPAPATLNVGAADRISLSDIAADGEWRNFLAGLFGVDAGTIGLHTERLLKKQQTGRRITRIVTIALIAALLATGGLVLNHRREAEERKQRHKIAAEWARRAELALAENQRLAALHLLTIALLTGPAENALPEIRRQTLELLPLLHLQAIIRHSGPINGTLFNRDESRILTWSADRTLRLWDAGSGAPLSPDFRHQDAVDGAIFYNREQNLLSWGQDARIRRWDLSRGLEIEPAIALPAAPYRVILNDRENTLIALLENFSLQIHAFPDGDIKGAVIQHKGWINGAAFVENESMILTWSDDSTAQFWNAATGVPAGLPLRHAGGVDGARLSSDAKRLLTWSSDGSVILWNVQNHPRRLHTFRHEGRVLGAMFDAPEEHILSYSEDGTARLWPLSPGSDTALRFRHDNWVVGAAFSPNEYHILTWSYDNSARLWEAGSGDPLTPPLRHGSGPLGRDKGVFGAEFLPRDSLLITWGDDATIRLWKNGTGKQYGAEALHRSPANMTANLQGLALTEDNKRLVSWSDEGTLRIWKVVPDYPESIAAQKLLQSAGSSPSQFAEEINRLTGTRYDTLSQTVTCLPVEQ